MLTHNTILLYVRPRNVTQGRTIFHPGYYGKCMTYTDVSINASVQLPLLHNVPTIVARLFEAQQCIRNFGLLCHKEIVNSSLVS
jgi:hypothetical protein